MAIVYFKGAFVPDEEAKISIRTHAFNYGTAIFEGIRGYWNAEKEQLFVLHMEKHYERIKKNSNILMFPFSHTVAELSKITIELLKKNNHREDVYIRPLYYMSEEKLTPKVIDPICDMSIYTMPLGDYLDVSKGIKVMVSSWTRLPDSVIPARTKVTGGYVNSALGKTEALRNGFDECIMLNENGHVCEGSAENIFIVRDGKLITPQVSDSILEGITRACIMEIAQKEFGIPVVERSIGRSELYIADEIFLCGTGAQVSPVTEVDRRAVGNGEIGEISNKIKEKYFSIVKGKEANYAHWLTPVF